MQQSSPEGWERRRALAENYLSNVSYKTESIHRLSIELIPLIVRRAQCATIFPTSNAFPTQGGKNMLSLDRFYKLQLASKIITKSTENGILTRPFQRQQQKKDWNPTLQML